MSWLPIGFYKTNAQIQAFDKGNRRFANISDRRSAVKIAVIDDNPFEAEVNLRSHGYDVRQIGDIKKVREVEGYPIVLCDLMGVGLHFDRVNQGNRLIKEIKANYPAAYVLAYTGAGWGQPVAQTAAQIADDIIQKDISIEDWVEKLDEFVRGATNPYIIWNRTRLALIKADIDTKDLLIIEDAYVRSIQRMQPSMTYFVDIISRQSLQGDVRAIVQGLAASAIFKAIVG